MSEGLRTFASSDVLVALLAALGFVCAILAFRIWRSPQSWHIDGETKDLRFHAWPEILMASAGACAFALITFLTF